MWIDPWTLVSISLAVAINFLAPETPQNYKSNVIDQKYFKQYGFPFDLGENLTDEEVNYRIRVIYISLIFAWLGSFSCAPILGQVLVPLLPPSVPLEVLIRNEADRNTKTQNIVLTTPLVKAAADKWTNCIN